MIGSLSEPSLSDRIDQAVSSAQHQTRRHEKPLIAISPYRFNPLGAHIDHQGGRVLARTLNQYTLLCFWPRNEPECVIHFEVLSGSWQCARFSVKHEPAEYQWDAMARASLSALAALHPVYHGIEGVVSGTLISGGLSSSASVILAYLQAIAQVNSIELTARDLVELVRVVENNYRGLNNGVQDQMSIAFGKSNCLSVLDVENVSVTHISDPATMSETRFLMCYSGISRDLAGSGFNTRVSECGQAARLLCSTAKHLGQVPLEERSEPRLSRLPEPLNRRAKHVYGEMNRVELGKQAWLEGAWHEFGQLMNESCQSSIHDYQSGSEWLINLHQMALGIPGVYGNRFSGGGYGGCLFLLVDANEQQQIAEQLLSSYLNRYPELTHLARVVLVESEDKVRIVNY